MKEILKKKTFPTLTIVNWEGAPAANNCPGQEGAEERVEEKRFL